MFDHIFQLGLLTDKIILWDSYQIVETPWLIKSVTKTVKRTWQERLLSKPWQATRQIVEKVPDPDCYRVGNNILCHPATRLALERQVKAGIQHWISVKSI